MERNVYLFLAAMLIVVLLTSLYLVQYNRRLFDQVAALSERRSELAQQLIAMQENTFRSISRELHDDFGQILTAIGAMLQRTSRALARTPTRCGRICARCRRSCNPRSKKCARCRRRCIPVILDEIGFESALDQYLPAFEKQTGIDSIDYEKTGAGRELGSRSGHPSVSRDAGGAEQRGAAFAVEARVGAAAVICRKRVVLEVEDRGRRLRHARTGHGMGLVSMRERAELVNGDVWSS